MRSRFCLGIGLGVALVTSGPARAAEPEPDRFALAWVRAPGAETCVTSRELTRLLEQTVGAPLATAAHATVLIDGIVAPKPAQQGFQVLIRATTADGALVGERRLDNSGARCSELTRSTLLVLAVMLNPDVVGRGLPEDVRQELDARDEREPLAPSAEQPAQNPQPEIPREPHAVRPDELERPEPTVVSLLPRRTETLTVAADLAASTGHTPRTSLGPELIVEGPFAERWAAQLEALFFPVGTAVVHSAYAADDVRFSTLELGLSACYTLAAAGTVRAAACAGAVGGARFMSAMDRQAPPAREYFGPAAGLGATWSFTRRLLVDWRAHLAWLPRDDRFVFTEHDGSAKLLWDPPPFAASVALGLGAKL